MKRCFVIGPIGDKMAPHGSPRRVLYEDALAVYEDVIKPACVANDLEAIRADGIAVPGEITNQIFRHLYEDEVVIADVSGGNPNVMYELGLRHTRDLLTIQIGEYGDLPFDVQALRTIMFSRSERGLIDARQRLTEALKVGLAEGSDPLPATVVWSAQGGPVPPSGDEDVLGDDAEDDLTEPEPEDERGYVERMMEIEEALPQLTETTEAIGQVLERLGNEAAAFGSDAEALNESLNAAQRMAVIVRYGKSLEPPADELDQYTQRFAETLHAMDPNVKGILQGMLDAPSLINAEDSETFLSSISGLAQATREGMEGLNEFGVIAGQLGYLSKALRRPGQKMQGAIRTMATASALIDEWDSMVIAVRASQTPGEIPELEAPPMPPEEPAQEEPERDDASGTDLEDATTTEQ